MRGPFYYLHSTAVPPIVLALVVVLALAAAQPHAAQAEHRRGGAFTQPNCATRLHHPSTPRPCGDILLPPATTGTRVNSTIAQNSAYRLAIYYAVPADIPFAPAVFERIQAASRDIQAWYQAATGA
jgi:hypothetical protein